MYIVGIEDDDYDDDDEKDFKLMLFLLFVLKGIKLGDGKSEKFLFQSSFDKSKVNIFLVVMLFLEFSNIDVVVLFLEFRYGQVSKENNIDFVISNLYRQMVFFYLSKNFFIFSEFYYMNLELFLKCFLFINIFLMQKRQIFFQLKKFLILFFIGIKVFQIVQILICILFV